jgi:hypothetical protein
MYYPAQSAPVVSAPPVVTTGVLGTAEPVTTVTAHKPNLAELTPPVAKKYEQKVGHEQDYSWITGHLFYIHANGGQWVVRYALIDEVDKFGGSVVLAPGVEMRNYREGDLVCVMGDVLNDSRASGSSVGAVYRVNTISLIERADP